MYFISFPRSGCMWIQGILEIYFERPREPLAKGGITWLDEKSFSKPALWTHSHDSNLDVKPTNKDILLTRNSVEAIFSFCYKHPRINGGVGNLNRENIRKKTLQLKKILEKWKPLAAIEIKYENFLREESAMKEIKKISEHLKTPFDEQKAKDCYRKLEKKETLVKKANETRGRWHDSILLKKTYNQEREKFKKEWSNFIISELSN